MLELSGPLAIASVVLAAGGFYKLRDPGSTSSALAALGLPSARGLVRLLGLVEVSVGTAAVLLGGRVPAAAVTVLYLGFAVVAFRLARRAEGSASCGCFGAHSSEATGAHVVIDLVVAAVAAAATLADAPGLLAARDDLALGGVPYLAFVALGAWLLGVLLTVLPDTLSAARRGPAPPPTVRTFEITGSAK